MGRHPIGSSSIELIGGLPIVSAVVSYQGNSLIVDSVLLDTGSGGTLFAADRVTDIGIVLDPLDDLALVSGVGGSEFVFSKTVDSIRVGELELCDFKIEIGAMDYGIGIDGIIGMDFLGKTGAIIDLKNLLLSTAE